MRYVAGLLCGLGLGFALRVGAGSVSFTVPVEPYFTALRITDGDTFRIEPLTTAQELAWADRGSEAVRLLCVSAPETDEPGGSAATAWLAAHIHPGSTVELEPGPEPRDNFARMLAWVKVDGVDLNLAAVRDGVARVFRVCPRMDEFQAAEKEARAARRGVWR